ncbi:hypothetical protein K470DRAFT_199139, partial [Piedraia hortae CBS 480.64]
DPDPRATSVFAEDISDHRLGGYHPICLGDTFSENCYKILPKLGYSSHSRVWAARDRQYAS